MAKIPVPTTPEEITADWLTAALAQTLEGAQVASVSKERIGEGAGFVGILDRITLTYAGAAPEGAPRSVISKIPTTDPAFRNLGNLLRLYEREHRFYGDVAAQTPVSAPRIYHNGADAESQSYVLIMEDIAPARAGDQLASCSLDEARLALRELARLHATWWEHPRLDDFDWAPTTRDPLYQGLLMGVYRAGLPALLEKQGRELPEFPAALFDIAGRFSERGEEALAGFATLPRTVAHYDYRLDNMLFDAPRAPLVVIDWQLCQRDSGLLDVVYFLSGNLPVEVRRAHERELLEVYHGALTEAGVSGYGFDQCWEDYRFAALALLFFMVTGQDQMNVGDYNERAQTLLQTMFERYSTAILDLECAEFLPA